MNEIVKQGDVIHNLSDLQGVARTLALSGFFTDAQGSGEVAVAKATAKILAGRELGFAPFASMNGIYLIQGRPSVSANLMASAVRKSQRYDYKVLKMEAAVCEIEFFELEGGKRVSLGVSQFTKEDASKAGTKNMGAYPRNMLFARAMSNGVRWFCPDVFDGNAVYTPEELGADVDEEGNVVEGSFRTVDEATGEVKEQNFYPDEQPTKKNGNGKAAPATLSADTLKHLHALGRELHGDLWDEKRPAIVKWASMNRVESSKDLTEQEAQYLIAKLNERLAELKRAAAAEEAAGVPAVHT